MDLIPKNVKSPVVNTSTVFILEVVQKLHMVSSWTPNIIMILLIWSYLLMTLHMTKEIPKGIPFPKVSMKLGFFYCLCRRKSQVEEKEKFPLVVGVQMEWSVSCIFSKSTLITCWTSWTERMCMRESWPQKKFD